MAEGLKGEYTSLNRRRKFVPIHRDAFPYKQVYNWAFLWLLAVFSLSCDSQPEPAERPVEHWVKRSVLDLQPRMISLNLHPRGLAAYNMETCLPYKVWEGGIHWDGAAYNNIKTVQPASWGNTYWKIDSNRVEWKLMKGGRMVESKINFEGYEIKDNRIHFAYSIKIAANIEIKIQERPEFILNEQNEAVFLQQFRVTKIPNDYSLFYGKLQLQGNQASEIKRRFPLFEELIPDQRKVFTDGSQNWLDRSGCNTCHEMDAKTIGPSYKEIARQYEKSDENFEYLISKVKEGGAGVWGEVPMSPHPHLKESDIGRMVNFILNLVPKKSQSIRRNRKARDVKKSKPGFGAALTGVHPGYDLQTIRPPGFKPRVGGMDFLPDGRLLVSTWDSIGAVYALDHVETGDSTQITVQRIAEGLHEPLGLGVRGNDIFVMQKPELTQLIDHDGDGIIDEYKSICNDFQVSADFHEYAYGLAFKENEIYANLGLAMRLMSTEFQLPDRGTTIKISPDGSFEKIMTGLRQANGIGDGPAGTLLISENQGRWVPACNLKVVEKGTFHGCYKESGDRFDGLEVTPPAVWLPQDEIGNSPSQPILIPNGIFKDQVLLGEVTHGGLKRIYLEQVNGRWQGSVFRFSQGFEAGINRMARGPDGALYVGGVGMNGNWSWQGKQYGLQRLEPNGKIAFDMQAIKATPEGIDIVFTEALSEAGISKDDIFLQQWRYEATSNYGGPKLDVEELEIREMALSADHKTLQLKLPGLKKGHVIYVRLGENLESVNGKKLWAGEGWYTMNEIAGDRSI